MTYAINAKEMIPPEMPVAWPYRQTLADQTAATNLLTTVTAGGWGDLTQTITTVPARLWYIRCRVKVKALTGTFVVSLEAADNSTFSTNRRQGPQVGFQTASVLGTLVCDLWTDDSTNTYFRLNATAGTTATLDAEAQAMIVS